MSLQGHIIKDNLSAVNSIIGKTVNELLKSVTNTFYGDVLYYR